MFEKRLKQYSIYDKKPPLTNHKIIEHCFSHDQFSSCSSISCVLQHALAKFQPATTCNSQNTSQNTQKHQKHAIVLSKPVALYFHSTSNSILFPLHFHPSTILLLRIGGGGCRVPIIGWLDVCVVPSPSNPLSGLAYFLSTKVRVAVAQL